MSSAIYKQKFCKRLRRLRLQAGYSTQEEFALDLGVATNTYATYESRTLLPDHLKPLACELLNCSPWMLLTGQPGQFSPPFHTEDMPLHKTALIECG